MTKRKRTKKTNNDLQITAQKTKDIATRTHVKEHQRKFYFIFWKLVGLFMLLNATFNNISVISWQSVLLVEETGAPRQNHRPVASH